MTASSVNAAVRYAQTVFEARPAVGLSDGQLLDCFVAHGEGASLEALVRRHGQMVWGVCRRLLRDYHDAEDAFQAVFLVLARKAASIRPREQVGNWLYGVAYQTARKARATRAKRRMREGEAPGAPEPEAVPHVGRNDLAELLDHELRRLPDKYRTPVVLCELEGKTHGEAAEQLGWPVGTVSGRLSRARAMLAKRLNRRGLSLAGGALAVLLARGTASAGVPAPLLSSTVKAASLFAAGRAAGPISANAAALTKEVLKTMLLSRIKITTAITTTAFLALALAGAGLWQVRSRANEQVPGAGASRAAVNQGSGKALPDGKFRVTVTEVTNDDSTIATRVGIEVLPGSTIELTSDSNKKKSMSLSVTPTSSPNRPNGPASFEMTLRGDHIGKGGATKAVRFTLSSKVGKISASSSSEGPMPAGAKRLADVFKVSIKPGEHKYGVTTKVLTSGGVTYSLVVKKPK